MPSFVASSLFTASLGIWVQAASSLSISSSQCWHEYPFSTVNLQSSRDGNTYNIDHIQVTTVNPPSYAPWSYPPICTSILESVGDKLCVYTNTSFSNNRGISLFTTPSIAAHVLTLPPFQSPSDLSDQAINANSGAWYLSQLPGRGLGLLATKPMVFKDRVTAYTPVSIAYLETELSTMEREKFWRIAVDQLPEKSRSMYLDLATVYGIEQVKYQDVVKANTFQMEVGAKNHLAIFPETSRANHGCAPNAQYYIDPNLLTHFVHATRPIEKDEEILISYTSPLESTANRQDHLSHGFHFKCTCSRCTDTSSDAALASIQSLQKSLNDWSDSSSGSPALAEELLQLYRDEGLEGFMDVPYGFAALAYNAVGDEDMAREYAGKALELGLMKDGSWTISAQIWREMLKGPSGHWSYRMRML
ncbi:SET domain-containing protein [Massarina eburnea CBS 473.64]|uniref:SET domain-containing protein n=1 Tax=Massarina eburnea CBS 473.64 TaxID=1395130 RepID=A0A6A6RR60_9PLEO|nr:SET domain-containing protein [Massarina eburnea CBS 473.64]